MKTLLTASALIMAAAAGAGATAHHLYETNLSSVYALILKAALDPTASEADEASYLRQARVTILTVKDRETNEKLDQAFRYAAENCNEQFSDSCRLSEESIDSSMSYSRAIQLHEFERGSAEEKAASARSTELSNKADAASKAFDQCSAAMKKDNKLALAMFEELRRTAGLPPLKSKPA